MDFRLWYLWILSNNEHRIIKTKESMLWHYAGTSPNNPIIRLVHQNIKTHSLEKKTPKTSKNADLGVHYMNKIKPFKTTGSYTVPLVAALCEKKETIYH